MKLDAVPGLRTLLAALSSKPIGFDETVFELAAKEDRALLHPGDLLNGRFRIVDFLGRGGMGEVFSARDTLLESVVAVKVIRSEYVASEAARQRLIKEVRTARLVTNPNVCRVYDIEEATIGGAATLFITMELLHGETLSERLSRRPRLNQEQAEVLAIQLCDALCALHEAGIVHRDFKPGNVMVLNHARGARAVVMDFGLALALSPEGKDTQHPTLPGSAIGTPAYMSPEQFLGGRITPAADVYALGIVIGQMMTGLDLDSLLDRRAITAELQPAARILMKHASARWSRIIDRCLATQSASRYPSALELRDALLDRGRWPAAGWIAVVGAGVVLAIATITPAGKIISSHVTHRQPSQTEWGQLIRNEYDSYQAGRSCLDRYDKRGNIDRAVDFFEAAIKQNVNYAPAYAGVSEAYLRRNITRPDKQRVNLALDYARKAVMIQPELALCHTALGNALYEIGDHSQAVSEFKHAVELDPKSSPAYIGLAKLAVRAGRPAEAESLLRKAIAASPKDWIPNAELGIFYSKTARYDEAIKAWERSLEITPDNSRMQSNIGSIEYMMGRFDDAAAAFQKALQIDPSAQNYTNLGTMRFFQGRFTDAVEPMEKAVALAGNNSLYWGNLGDAYRWAPGFHEKAAEAYSHAISLIRERLSSEPDDPDLLANLAAYLAKSGNGSSAVAELAHFEQLSKKSASSLFRAAIAYEVCNKRDEALRCLGAAIGSGYSLQQIKIDQELISIRADVRYQRLLGSLAASTQLPSKP